MFFRGLKTNIAINLAVLFLFGMLLIDVVMIILTQRDLLKTEILKGDLLVAAIESHLESYLESGKIRFNKTLDQKLDNLVVGTGFSCVLIMGNDTQALYFRGTGCIMKDDLSVSTLKALEIEEKITRYFGTTWGVLWKQSRHMILSSPIYSEGKTVAAAGILINLEGIYGVLRRSQQILFIYILVNTIILTMIGLYQIAKKTVKPVHRLVKSAENYREDDELFFLPENEDNEFYTLSKALNRMLKRISEDKEKLQSNVYSLEKANIDLKQAQKSMIRAEKMASVGRLSAGIAHEIGNPLGIIVGYLELLKQEHISTDEKKEYLIRSENEINRIHTIIRQLLDFSRQSNGDLVEVSVHEIIEDVIQMIKLQPVLSNIHLKRKLSAESDTVVADPDQLRQVFLNLMINATDAISFSEKKLAGELIIETCILSNTDMDSIDQNPTLKIMYIDNGIGISETDLDNIFDPFYTTKEPGKGTGLGLWVCYMIIEGLGGKIEATSKEGEGTCVVLHLPLFNSDAG